MPWLIGAVEMLARLLLTAAFRSLAIAVVGAAYGVIVANFQWGWASFVLSDDPTVRMLAVGMAVAVLIDATVVRMILVPAVMAMLGRHAWWIPGWLDKITPNFELEGPTHPAPLPATEQQVSS